MAPLFCQSPASGGTLIQIGSFTIQQAAVLAPIAGVTDLPFRRLCKQLGAGLSASEMVTAEAGLWHTAKSRRRLPDLTEAEPRITQIAGAEPAQLAQAARQSVALGAQIIDINMGCPAKKVCQRAAGSALLADEPLVARILATVVKAVDVPVTLKIRTGTYPQQRNGATIARIAEDAGVQALAVHGRTRACRFLGSAEYDTIAAIVERVDIPVFANGDITSPEMARRVLDQTGAAGVMIGRGAQGRPWLFREINHFLATGQRLAEPSPGETLAIIRNHLAALHRYYGDGDRDGTNPAGIGFARKHMAWYLNRLGVAVEQRRLFNTLGCPQAQRDFIEALFAGTAMPTLVQDFSFNHLFDPNNKQEQAA
jgi:tRNA-dihydrouridine synthase B